MTSAWEQFEELIKAQMRKIYSETVIDHAMNPRNLGDMEDADGFARVTGPCGDTMKIMLKAENGRVVDVRFWTDGCGTSIACGSMLTKMIHGKTFDEISAITSKDLNNALNDLPEDHVHCTVLAVNTLRKAIKNYNNESNFLVKK